ncbi:F-box protein [Cardamine amara subsp. amara]|uniref:F-box protein n=1 Tax=Cardamine amara subsp. amara TaxID=228776 RepID=A0ABD1BEW5_CARAN
MCNPSTRQSLALPKVKTRKMIGVMMKRGVLGYDPINKQYKVLSMTWVINGRREEASVEHQVLTLGTENPLWRKIKCCIPHCPEYGEISEICINGVSFIKVLESFTRTWVNPLLINYNGKVGLLIGCGGTQFVNGRSTSIKMGVLQDVEKQEWSEHIYVLPALWQNIVGDAYLCCVGVIRKNEIVLSSYYQNMPFYVFYYNTETTTITRVGFQGMEALKGNRVYTYLDHVENMTLL